MNDEEERTVYVVGLETAAARVLKAADTYLEDLAPALEALQMALVGHVPGSTTTRWARAETERAERNGRRATKMECLLMDLRRVVVDVYVAFDESTASMQTDAVFRAWTLGRNIVDGKSND